MTQLFNLMVQVMLPLGLLVAAGAFWPRFFADAEVAVLRMQLNRLVMYVFYPCILFAVSATTPIDRDLLSVPLLVGIGTLISGALLYILLYVLPIWRLTDPTRASLMLAGMFGNTFNIGVPVLIFFYGREATRYAVFNDMLMTMPLVWSLGVWIATRFGSHDKNVKHAPVWRVMLAMPPIWAFILGTVAQLLDIAYAPLVTAARFIGQATIPVILFVLGLTIPWRRLAPRPEILGAAAVKLVATPLIVWGIVHAFYDRPGEAQLASVVEGATPSMMTALLLADRFRLDAAAAALLIGWSTILFWITLPVLMAMGLIR
ncbi:MAG TPA: AEC family transporter [Burkholderiales bacterium]|nr:AEC family transporter [Burkholderiales bacterium]